MAEYAKLLVTTDFSAAALCGVEEARRLARRLGSRIVLLYVVEDRLPAVIVGASGVDRDRLLEEHRKVAEDNLKGYAGEHLPGCEVETLVRVGVPWEVVGEVAEEAGADLIVMATHGYGRVGKVLFGSTTQRVLQDAPCPVLVVRSPRE